MSAAPLSTRTRAEMLRHARDYVIINDGQYEWPALRAELHEGDTKASITAMDADAYAEFCGRVSCACDEQIAQAGTTEMSELCDELIEAGATYWRVG